MTLSQVSYVLKTISVLPTTRRLFILFYFFASVGVAGGDQVHIY